MKEEIAKVDRPRWSDGLSGPRWRQGIQIHGRPEADTCSRVELTEEKTSEGLMGASRGGAE